MKRSAIISSLLLFIFSAIVLEFNSGCSYSFNQSVKLSDTLKTVRVQTLINRAPYVNPQLSPNLTNRIKLKLNNQTKLTQVNSDNAQLDISGYITDYSVSTSGVSSNQTSTTAASINRLTVSVHIILNRTTSGAPPEEFDVSRSFDFSASKTIQAAEAELLDEMVRNLTDEIFNHIFSNW
jgi:hypothetical protein